MRSVSHGYIFSFVILLIFSACVEPYNPPIIDEDKNYLVVDGFLNSNEGSVTVNLSRTLPVYSPEGPRVELRATVILEDEQENSFTIQETGNGFYNSNALPIDQLKKYRLHIRTQSGDEYFSDYVPIKTTPPIDELRWVADNGGIQFYLDTHDPSGSTRYYKWDFIETFEYYSAFSSTLKVVNGQVLPRFESEYINQCWRTIASNNILVGTSAKLQEDAINHFPINYVQKGGYRLSRKYSILVKQQAITEEAYDYWLQLEQTTENLGGLFDPMPTQITGNFYNATNPTQPVLGYFSAGTIQSKRIFIDFYNLPDHLQIYPRSQCTLDSIPVEAVQSATNSTLLIGAYGTPMTVGYTTADPICIDCRVQGGTTTKPPFWE